MADLRISHYSAQTTSPTNKQQIKRITYLSIIPVLVLFMLVALFGMMGALPTLAQGTGPFFVTPGGSGSVCSIAAPCLLETAVSKADPGAEIRVAKGTYIAPDSASPVLALTKTLTLIGGYDDSDDSSWNAEPSLTLNETILDGQGSHRVISITAGISPTISNFFIKNGNVTGQNGAGIFIASGNGQPIISNNIIENNITSQYGGGIYDGAGSIIEHNEIFNNKGNGEGGGGIAVENDVAGITTTIRFNKIYSNTAASTGGGVLLRRNGSQSPHVLLIANEIYRNAAQYGGGVGAFQTNTEMTLFSNMIFTNTATGVSGSAGGGLYTNGKATLWSNTFAENRATSNGGGIALGSAPSSEISNNIIAFNTSTTNDGINAGTPGNVTGTHNNIFGDATNVTLLSTVTTDPEFVNRAGLNFHIQGTSPASPAIDAGSTAPTWVNIDIDEQVRPNPATSIQDIGADEYYADFAEFELTPPVTDNIVERSTTEIFTHSINNIGTVDDRYDIECSSDLFTVSICASPTVSVTAGSSINIQTSVDIPENLDPYQVGTTTITATSHVSPTLSEVAVVRSTVALRPGIEFTPNISRTELPGEIITLTHILTNTGDSFDDFTITKIYDPGGWAALLPQDPLTISLNADEWQNIRVQINVPEFAPQGLSNIIRIEAVSNFDPAISATVVETITAKATTGTRYVSMVGNDTNNNCTQSDKPCRNIAYAVGQVAVGDEVRIGAGVYTDTVINVNDTIHISGGWTNFKDDGQGDEPDATLTEIDGLGAAQIFRILAGNPIISDLTLRRGNSTNGGAVFVGNISAQSELNNIIFDTNTATEDGGAVFMSNGTSLAVKDSFFINNTAGSEGGGLYMTGGFLTINQSRFLTNTASVGGGGFSMNTGNLAAAQNNLFYNNTTSGNGGGVRLNGGSANFDFNTWVENSATVNGGGVYNNGTNASIENSIFADNSANAGSGIYQNSGTTALDYLNMWQNQSNVAIGTHSFTADPMFANEEFRLADGSPAIDTADPDAILGVDFENDARPADQGHDIGYDERAGCRAMRDEDVFGSIQDAVDVVDAESDLVKVSGICRGVHTIDVAGVAISQTVHLTKSIVIQGGWNDDFSERTLETTIVDPEERGRGFVVTDGVSVTIEAISVTNGIAIDLGGPEPIVDGAGGGIYNVDGDLTLRGVTVVSSTATTGGGVYNENGSMLITWEAVGEDDEVYYLTNIFTNTAVSGAGVFNESGDLTIDGAWIAGNEAQSGAGVFNQTGVMTVVNTILDGNTAVISGGGLYNEAISATVAFNTFFTNTAATSGGGVYDDAGSLVVESNIFESNRANDGSAIFASGTGTQADYNYYYDNSNTAVSGTDAGPDSIASATAPGLVDPLAGDFHLMDEAPAIDMGNPDSFLETDFEDDPRPANQGFDMGADEVIGCLVMVNDVMYGSLQAAIDAAEVGDDVNVYGTCSGVHEYDTGFTNACGGDAGEIQTAVHLIKNVNLLGGWDEEFEERDQISILDAKNRGRVLYIGPGVTSTVDGFAMINGLMPAPQGNGAGICIDQASPTIQNNRIYSNTAAANGGGIYSLNGGALIDGGNYIYENEASNGGGIYLDVESGETITSSINNNFIYNNQATNGAGVYANRGAHSILHNTVVSNTAAVNGGGFHLTADVSEGADIRGQIIMGNIANSGGGVYGSGTAPNLDYNDYYQNSSDFGGNATGGANSIAVDPMFSNPVSGVFTITIDSPVVDITIPDMPLTTDYEGDIRPSNQGYDLGADEVGGCFAMIASDPATIYGSVQLAVDLAEENETIFVDGICQGVNSRQADSSQVSQTLLLTKSLTIDGSWDYEEDTSTITTTLDALSRGRVIYVAAAANVTITNIILQNGAGDGAGNGNNGGGIYNNGSLVLANAWVQQNTAVSGAGIYNQGSLVVTETAVLTNTAQTSGGGLFNNGPATINGSDFQNNTITQYGGGIFQESGTLIVDGNRIHHNGVANTNGSAGGGIYLNSGSSSAIDIWNNFIYKNQAETGGGLYNANTDVDILHNTFVNNIADGNGNGAGITTLGGSPDIRNNIVDNNFGSGIYARGSNADIDYNVTYNTLGFTDIDADGTATIGSQNLAYRRPSYVNEAEEDYHLKQISVGVDTGELVVSTVVKTDIDGDIRPNNSGPDMGADEINSCLVQVGSQIFTVLQTAINYAEDNDFTEVRIARGECRGVMTKEGTEQVAYISANKTIQLIGSLNRETFGFTNDYDSDEVGTVSTLINAIGEGRTVYIAPGANVSFTHVALVNGNAYDANDSSSENGGAVYNNAGSASFSETFLCQSYAQDGGGYYGAASSNADTTGTTIGQCTVAQVTEDPPGTLDPDSVIYYRFLGNAAEENGGGIFVGGSADFRNVALWGNYAGLGGAGNGGGIYNSGNNNRIVNGIVYSNTVPNNGAGVYNSGGNFQLLHNTISKNTAGGEGGGVYNSGGGFSMNSSIIYDNSSVSGSGGLQTGSAALRYNNFEANTPSNSSVALGATDFTGDPGLFGAYLLSVDSQNIDAADPALLELPFEIDFDVSMNYRPDGIDQAYVPPAGVSSDVGAWEYIKDFACAIVPDESSKIAYPGDFITFTLNITNTGNPSYLNEEYWRSNGYTDTITVTVESQVHGWGEFEGGDIQTVELGWQDFYPYGEATTRVLTVTVPATATIGVNEVIDLKCQSASLPSRKDTTSVTAEIGVLSGVEIVPPYFDEAAPGDVRVYTHTVINKSNDVQTYLLIPSSGPRHASAVLLETDTLSETNSITVTLAPFETEGYTTTTYLQVTILDTAMAGDTATPGIVATGTKPDDNGNPIVGAVLNVIDILPTTGTRYVDVSGSNTTNCTNPLLPCLTIQHAIGQASAGDEILVAEGTYQDDVVRIVEGEELHQTVFVNKPITLRGGYATGDFSIQEPLTNTVFLDGEGARRVIYVADGISMTMSGLFIQNGYANTQDYGGGIYNVNGNLTITATWVLSNGARLGGGIYHENGELLLNNSVIAQNTNKTGSSGAAGGAGLFISNTIATLENNTFVNNLSVTGADLDGDGIGHAIYQDGGSAVLVNHIFDGNQPGLALEGDRHAVYITGTAVITNDYNLYHNQTDPINVAIGVNSISDGDPQFIDTYFHIGSSSAALDNGTTADTLVRPDLLTSGDYELEDRTQGTNIDMGADERTQAPGFLFEPEVLTATIEANTAITYNHYLTNTGDFVDSYVLSMTNQVVPDSDPSWSWDFYPDEIIDLGIGESAMVTVVITGGTPGFYNVTTITATSASELTASVQDTTTISHTAEVDIEQYGAQIGLPGQLVTYSHTLTNTGNGIDQFELTATAVPTDWIVTLVPAQTEFLSPTESIPVTVTVLVPADAFSGTQHVITVTAVATDPFATDYLTDTTTVGLLSALTLEPDNARDVPDGTSTIYTHTLTSNSNIVDTITLTATGSLAGWDVSIEPESVIMNPLETRIISVTVDVPPNTGGLIHLTHVTATSTLPDLIATATNTTTVPTTTGLLFTPNLTETVYAGEMAYYTHTLTNLGNLMDTFNISSNSVEGWIYDVTGGLLEVGPGASVQVTAVISVPLGTPPTTDILEITATSQTVVTTTATVTDTTRVIQFVALTFTPDHDETGNAGTTKVYTHTLTNDGDGSDTFNLTYSGVPPWTVTLEPSTSITLGVGETAVITANLTIPNGASGYTNTTTITATSAYSPAISAAVVNTTTVSGVVAQLGVLLEPDRFAVGNLGETITYYHTVTNTGDATEDFDLFVASSVWVTTVEPEQIELASGESAPVTVTVTIPLAAPAGEEDMAVITAVSQSDPSVSSSVTDTTRVVQTHGLLFFPDNAQTTDPSTTVFYTHTLQNTGNAEDTFVITPNSSNGWTVAVASPVTVASGESTTVHITLTVPAGTGGQVDVMQVTASSIISPAYTAMVTNTTTVNEGIPPVVGVDIEPDHTEYAVAEDVITYVHVVTNTGEGADTFSITAVSSQRWIPIFSPASLTLASGETGTVIVTVTVPVGVNPGTRDETTVTVTSQSDATVTDSAVDTTIIPGIFLPIIIKPATVVNPTPTPPPGPTVTPSPTATPGCTGNTGIDLIVERILVDPGIPAAGIPAVVHVTIKNRGTVNVAPNNNFYVDFYVDRAPARYLVGEIEWGVQGEWMQAGQSYTFSRNYTFSGGSHQLWAQVDTDNTVDECPFEDNNVLGPLPITVSGTSNVTDQDAQNQRSVPNDAPRHTPTPNSSAGLSETNVQPVITERPLSTPTPVFTATPPPRN